MKPTDVKGVYTALVTPFIDNRIDESRYVEFIDWQINSGIHGLVPCGTTGESPTLTHEEHLQVVEICVKAAKGRVPVMAGTGSNSTAEAIEFTQHAQKTGADMALLVSPYYNKPTQEGLFQHFKAIHDATDIPLVIYNIPGRSVIDIADETLARLAELPLVIGVKDATGDLSRVSTLRYLVGDCVAILSGEDMTAIGFNAQGGQGCISVTSNVAPNLCAAMQEATLQGDYAKAYDLHKNLIPLHSAMFCESSPSPVKYALAKLGRIASDIRQPLLQLSPCGQKQVDAALEYCGLS
jgi:4-hydroxy-tetrahydrodipicolinate synthase